MKPVEFNANETSVIAIMAVTIAILIFFSIVIWIAAKLKEKGYIEFDIDASKEECEYKPFKQLNLTEDE